MEEIITMFPTTVLKDEIGPFTEEELKELEIYKTDIRKNTCNTISTNQQVLTNEKLNRLKQKCIDVANTYMIEILGSKVGKLKPEVCLSWLTWTENNQEHHRHYHPNSFLSGVIYIEATEGDTIIFHKEKEARSIWIEPENGEYNWYNSLAWQLGVKTGDIIIFPSNIEHAVKPRPNLEGLRTSLAFNIIPRGEVGSWTELSNMKL